MTSPGSPGKVHYLPHRVVVKNGKKIRIVFDGSAKMEGPSINDSLYKGPCLLTSIYDILLRFRLHPIGIIADIRQAFLNIAVSEEHRDFLRFLWQENQDLIIYRFLRVLFGLKSSPFLLNGTIQYHMEPYRSENPELVEKFLRNLYVDDSINGVKSVKEGVEFYKFVKACMRDAAFDMRKWYTNSVELMKLLHTMEENEMEDHDESNGEMRLPQNVGNEDVNVETEQEFKKVLGILWDGKNDRFVFNLESIADEAYKLPLTKRSILCVGATFYDPLGLISPVFVYG